MLRRSRRENQLPVTPRTTIGHFLRAVLLKDVARRRQLAAELDSGDPKARDNPAVVQAAAELATRRLWGTSYDIRDVTAAVTFIRDADLAAGKAPRGQLEMEAVIRTALGEPDVDVSGISLPVLFEIQAVATSYVVLKLHLSESEIDQLIAEAEDIAFERGWHPQLAA